jgi:hypothetical protein
MVVTERIFEMARAVDPSWWNDDIALLDFSRVLLAYDRKSEEALRAALAEQQRSDSEHMEPVTWGMPRREVELTANAILNLMPDSIPAEHDGALIEFARAVIAAYRAKQGETK